MITDRVSNSASYIDAVEAFGVQRFPSPFQQLFVVTVRHRDKEDDVLPARLRVTSPAGKELFALPLPEQVLAPDVHRHNVGMGGFNLEEAGEHRVVVERRVGGEWREARALPFVVELIDTQPKKADAKPGAD